MKKVSRRELARSAAQALVDGKEPKRLIKEIAAYLIENNMTDQADMLMDDLAVELQARTGHTTATVRTATRLSADNRKALEDYIRDQTGAKEVELTVVEDPSILGGVVIRTPQYEYDASVRHKINQLKSDSWS